eukprot:7198143-Prymnesium_polylepis.1
MGRTLLPFKCSAVAAAFAAQLAESTPETSQSRGCCGVVVSAVVEDAKPHLHSCASATCRVAEPGASRRSEAMVCASGSSCEIGQQSSGCGESSTNPIEPTGTGASSCGTACTASIRLHGSRITRLQNGASKRVCTPPTHEETIGMRAAPDEGSVDSSS